MPHPRYQQELNTNPPATSTTMPTHELLDLEPPQHSFAGKKLGYFSIYACHPCSRAMLIFSVSFQLYRMSPKGLRIINLFLSEHTPFQIRSRQLLEPQSLTKWVELNHLCRRACFLKIH